MSAPATPLRVLHIGKYYPPYRGGMESFLADLIEQQRASGVDARAIVHGDPLPDDPPWVTRIPVQVTLVFAPIALGFPLALWRAVRRFKPDVIHMHMPNNAAFWALVLPGARRVPWVIHWHSDVLISRWEWVLAACYQLYRPFQHKLLHQAAAILATSPPYMAASQPLQAWLYKTVAIPLGLKHFAGDALASDAASSGTPPQWGNAKLRILSVGRLTYYKGFDTLISAVAGQPDAQLLIAGEGEQRGALEQLIAHERTQQGCANVELLGAVSEADKHALFNSCDVFALASRERTEAFGLVLVEAMQHGKPCIVSDLEGSGMSWIVSQAEGGRCYATDQVSAWKTAITQCLATKAELGTMGQAARRAASQQFTIAQCERRIRDVYLSVLEQSEAVSLHRYQPVAGRALHVLIVSTAADWVPAAQANSAHTVIINASGQAMPRALEDAAPMPPVIDLAPHALQMADALELVKHLVVDQGAESLTIQPISQRSSWLGRLPGWRRKPHADAAAHDLTLEGSGLQAWLRGATQGLEARAIPH